MDIELVCRTCLKENAEMQSIFTGDARNSLPTMITACTVTTVSELDGLPAQMCLQCIRNVQTSFDFKKQCESAYETLKSVLGIHIHDPETTDDDKAIVAGESLAYIAPGEIIDFDSDLDDVKLKTEVEPLLDNVNEKSIQTDETSFFSCEMCTAKFMQDQDLRTHRLVHKDEGFKCRVCQKIYSRLCHLQQHFAFKHPHEPVARIFEEIVCKLCTKQFSRRDHLKRHMLIHAANSAEHKSYKCDECDESFRDERDFLNHEDCWGGRKSNGSVHEETVVAKPETQSEVEPVMATVKAENDSVKVETDTVKNEKPDDKSEDGNDDPEPFVHFSDANDASSGLSSSSDDEDDEVYVPEVTIAEEEDEDDEEEEAAAAIKEEKEPPRRRGRPPKLVSVKQKSILAKAKKPQQTLPKEKAINKCEICSKVFSRATHLKRHLVTHSDVKPYGCNICDKKFSRIDHLNIHRFHHSDVKPHICDVCQRGFTRAEHLRKHKEARHGDKTGQAPKTEFCSVCQKGFTTPKYLQVHMRSHTDRIFACKFCEEKFGSKATLNEHQKKHINERPFLCSECGLRFVRNDYLVIHMRRHKGEKPYKCKYCNKGFPRATDLTVHERYHTGEKTHLCTICGKGFQRAYNLLVHTRVHTGERPYQCPHCVKSFAQGNDLKAHVRRHTGERYKCDVCGDGFIQGYHLTQHKRTVHGIDMKSHIRRVEKVPGTSDAPDDTEMDLNNLQELQQLQQLHTMQQNGGTDDDDDDAAEDDDRDMTMLQSCHIKLEPPGVAIDTSHIDITNDSQSSDVAMRSNTSEAVHNMTVGFPHAKLSDSYK